MNKKVRVNLQDHMFHGSFPDLCVYCGKPKKTDLIYTLAKQDKTDNQTIFHKIELKIPYCEEHTGIALRNKKIGNVLLGISIAFALIAAILAFTFVFKNGMFGMKEGAGLFIVSLLVVAGAAYFTFMILFQILRLIVNVWSRKFSGYPVDDPLGISFTISQNTNTVDFFFTNIEIMNRFKEINLDLIDQDAS